jgi:hypothetical protein
MKIGVLSSRTGLNASAIRYPMLTVRVYNSGFLSTFGHNHEIQAPIPSGDVKEVR